MLWGGGKGQAPTKNFDMVFFLKSINTVHHDHDHEKEKKKRARGKEEKGKCEPRPWRRMRRFSSVPSSLGI
jgi:hypothetical protein